MLFDVVRWALLLLPLMACRTATSPTATPPVKCGATLRKAAPLMIPSTKTTTMSFDFRHMIGRRELRRKCVDATIAGQVVEIQPFGNMSSEVCTFPKLIVHAGGKKHVLITHCNEREAVGTELPTGAQVHGHALAYRLFETLGFVALGTVRRDLVYRDEPTQTSISARPAFFLEFLDDLLERTSMEGIEDADPSDLDRPTTTRFALYQVLINNRDWRLLDIHPVENPYFGNDRKMGTHNVFLARREDGAVIPIAYDLELSGFVGIPRGIRALTGGEDETLLDDIASPALLDGEPWLVRWMIVRLLDFQRRFDQAEQREATAHFRSQRAAIESLVADDDLPSATRIRAENHVESFFRALDLVGRIRRTKAPIDLFVDSDRQRVVCPAVPVGTPYDTTMDGSRKIVRLLWRLRLDGDEVKPMCEGEDLRGYAPSSPF